MSVPLPFEVSGARVVHVGAFVLVEFEGVEDGEVGGFLLGVLEEARGGDVGDVVAVEVHEGELEDETHEVVEVGLREGLGVEHFVEAAFRHAVVAGVEVEGGTAVLDDVAVDVDAGLEVVEFVLARVELEDFGGDAFVGGEEVQLHAVAAELGEGLGEEGDLGVLQRALLDLGDAVAEHDDAADGGVVAVLELEHGALDDVLEGEFGFLAVAQVGLGALGDVVGAEEREVGAELAEDGADGRLAAALFVVDGEDHGAAAEPAQHGFLEGDLVAEVVGHLEDDVVHEVEHDHLEEVVLLEGLREDDLVGHLAVFVAQRLDDHVRAREQVLARA